VVQDSFEVIYLTGSPATGKSSLTQYLQQHVRPLTVFAYSKLLADHIAQRHAASVTENQLRERSALLVTREDVATVDAELINAVQSTRRTSHVIIDSHAVTKEKYGFRVTPFSIEKLRLLNPTMIVDLFADSSVVLDRIRHNSQGRPTISSSEADLHTNLQATVALTYAVELNVPIYFVDSSGSVEHVGEIVMERMRVSNNR
jgi:adenylate kinase